MASLWTPLLEKLTSGESGASIAQLSATSNTHYCATAFA